MWPKKYAYNFDNWPDKKDKNKPVGVFQFCFQMKLRDSSLTYFSIFVLYREIVKNIDQMHDHQFFSCSSCEMDLMASSIWSRGTNFYFWILTIPINAQGRFQSK